MKLNKYIANLLAFLVCMEDDEANINSYDFYTTIPNDCEMTKIRKRKIIFTDNVEQINIDVIDDKLKKRILSPTNKYYKSILKTHFITNK